LFLARDRVGKKPLYYGVFKGVLHFGSEIKSIAKSPYWDDRTDMSALEGYLSLGYFIAPETPFAHVRQVPPAHWLTVRSGNIDVREYWDIPAAGSATESDETVLEQLKVDHALEKDAIARFNRGVELARTHGDNGSRHMLEEMLKSEEEHYDWIEAQLTLIEQVGESNYLAQQIRS